MHGHLLAGKMTGSAMIQIAYTKIQQTATAANHVVLEDSSKENGGVEIARRANLPECMYATFAWQTRTGGNVTGTQTAPKPPAGSIMEQREPSLLDQ